MKPRIESNKSEDSIVQLGAASCLCWVGTTVVADTKPSTEPRSPIFCQPGCAHAVGAFEVQFLPEPSNAEFRSLGKGQATRSHLIDFHFQWLHSLKAPSQAENFRSDIIADPVHWHTTYDLRLVNAAMFDGTESVPNEEFLGFSGRVSIFVIVKVTGFPRGTTPATHLRHEAARGVVQGMRQLMAVLPRTMPLLALARVPYRRVCAA